MLVRVLTLVAVLQVTFIPLQAGVATRNVDSKDFALINGRRYYFGLFDISIDETIDFCEGINMTVLSLETDAEGKAVSDFLMFNETQSEYEYWTGAMFVMDKWMWNGSGRMMNEASTLWYTNRPVATNSSLQACAYFRKSGNAYYLYDDYYCGYPWRNVACEERHC